MVDQNEYVLDPNNGQVIFYGAQRSEDFYTITVLYDSSFRVICKIENKGDEAVVIDHIALMYSIMKRFPRDKNGNILRQPLVNRI